MTITRTPLFICALAAAAPATPTDDPSAASLVETAAWLTARHTALDRGDHARVTALDEQIARSALPLVAARGQFEQARSAARGGALSSAVKTYATLGLAQGGWLIGPFEHTGAARLDAPTPPEVQGLAAGLAAGSVDGLPWQRVVAEPRDAILDVGAHLPRQREISALLVLVAVADRATPAALRLSTSAGVAAALNGQPLLLRDVHRPLGWDQDSVGVQLAAGPNLIVLRLGNLSGPLQARVRLTAPDGSSLAGVRFSTDVADRARALAAQPSSTAAPSIIALEQAIDAFIGAPPLHQPVAEGAPDLLTASIVVEEDRRRRDQRQIPLAHELWRLSLLLRLRTAPPSASQQAAVAATLVAVGDALADDNPTVARQRYDAALEVAPEHPAALLGLARLRAGQDLDAETVALLQRALVTPSPTDALLAEAYDGLRLRGWRTLEIDRALLARAANSHHQGLLQLAADAAEQRGDLPLAFQLGERLLALDEADPIGHHLAVLKRRAALATSLEGSAPVTGDDGEPLQRLLDRLERLVLHKPHAHRAVRALALALQSAGQAPRVEALLEERRQRYPALAAPYALTAELQTLRGDRVAARCALRDALLRTPQDRDLRIMLRTLDVESDDLARRYGLSPRDADGVPVPARAEQLGAHVVHHRMVARFYENGLGTEIEEQLIRIHDKDKAAGFAELSFPYAEGREVVEVLRAFRVRADGQRIPAHDIRDEGPAGKVGGVYTDERNAVVDFGQVESGDLLWIRVRKDLVGEENLFGAFFGLIMPMQLPVPVARSSLIIDVPQTRPLAFGGRGAPTPEIVDEGERRTYRFAREDLAAIEVEPNMPPWLSVADFISVSSIDRWEALGDWYEDLINGALVLDDELKARARVATRGAKTDAEKVQRLYELVVNETRYVGIELGIHGWRPYPVVEVFRRHYGDCKDKASLLIALLNAVGVEGRIVLTRTADLGHVPDAPPSMWLFNHAIAYVPSLDLYLDATSEHGGWRELPALDQGAQGLVVAPFSDAPPTWVEVPVDEAASNSNLSEYTLTLAPDGSLRVEGKERFTGALAAEQRAELSDKAFRQQNLERSLGSGLPGVKVSAFTAVGEALSATEVGYDFVATVPARARQQEDGTWRLPLSLYPQELERGWARRSDRTWGVWIQHPWRTRNTMRYRLPTGLAPQALPEPFVVENDAIRFEQRVTATPGGFQVIEETVVKQRHIAADAYPAFRAACARADERMRAQLVLVPAGGA